MFNKILFFQAGQYLPYQSLTYLNLLYHNFKLWYEFHVIKQNRHNRLCLNSQLALSSTEVPNIYLVILLP